MNSDFHSLPVLADRDVISIVAVLVFALIGLLGNVLNKARQSSEKERQQPGNGSRRRRAEGSGAEGAAPTARQMRQRMPPPLPIEVGVEAPPARYTGPRVRSTEKQTTIGRDGSTVPPGPGPRRPTDAQRTRALSPMRPAPGSSQVAAAPTTTVPEQSANSRTALRRAIIWAELLGPPVALRREGSAWYDRPMDAR